MKAQTYLESIERMKERIELEKEQLNEYRESATSISSHINTNGKVQGGSFQGSKVERYGILAVELEAKIAEHESEYWELCDTIERQIYGLHNIKWLKILTKVYLQNRNLKQAAYECEMSYATVLTQHQKALDEFGKVYKVEIAEWEKKHDARYRNDNASTDHADN